MTCRRRARSYWTTCRCDNCTLERSRKRKLHSVGKPYRVPNDVAWAKLTQRFEQGWSARAVASACGVPDYYFSDHHAEWKRGNVMRLGPVLAQAVMTMERPTAGQVGAEPSRRRLRALAVIGYSLTTMSEETGIKVSALAMIRNRNLRCSATTAATIEDTYTRLHMTPGPDGQAITSARAKGWHGPLAWDDIDDPNEQPTGRDYQERKRVNGTTADLEPVDQNVIDRILNGEWRLPASPLERVEIARLWVADGGAVNELSRRTGWKVDRYLKLGEVA